MSFARNLRLSSNPAKVTILFGRYCSYSRTIVRNVNVDAIYIKVVLSLYRVHV